MELLRAPTALSVLNNSPSVVNSESGIQTKSPSVVTNSSSDVDDNEVIFLYNSMARKTGSTIFPLIDLNATFDTDVSTWGPPYITILFGKTVPVHALFVLH